MGDPVVATTIAPWLTVSDGSRAVDFYENAFGATVLYRLDGDDATVAVAQMTVDGATFWVAEATDTDTSARADAAIRMILTVNDPDGMFGRAIGAGATQVAAVHEEHGWRTGRVTDPFGHDWELSKPGIEADG